MMYAKMTIAIRRRAQVEAMSTTFAETTEHERVIQNRNHIQTLMTRHLNKSFTLSSILYVLLVSTVYLYSMY